tara:strand:+ start:1312 stop:1554 length:243 start_codon:yes stop_codon:yes gene_type:complete
MPKLTEPELYHIAEKISAHAMKHENYEAGWDYIAECWTDREIVGLIGDADVLTYDDGIGAMQQVVDLYSERKAEAEAEIF